jgi:hypothetical protein
LKLFLGPLIEGSEEKLMNSQRMLVTLGLMLACVIVLPVARADQHDQATQLTLSQPVQIPGRVLPAGAYWFVLADNAGDRNIIHIFISERSMLYVTVQTITAERPQLTDRSAITFAERQSMQQNAIVTWFYPGHKSGHEFVYPKSVERELAQASRYTVTASAQNAGTSVPSGD